MHSSTWKFGRAFVCAALVAGAAFTARAEKHTEAAHDAMMAAAMKTASPGPQHQAIAKAMSGTWKTTTKSWMGPEPTITEGKSVLAPILGGRFVQEQHVGTLFGGPFEGVGLYGYDNAKKAYTNVWMDSFSTGIILSTGTMDASGKVLTLHGSYDDPMTGKEQTMRLVSKQVDDNTRLLEMYGEYDGKEMKMSEVTYKRM